MARESIPKGTRFEVLKRDKFTCQYCGRSAPDVILEIDHIQPVSKGGDNSIINLITSCRDCNRGKTNKELSDDTAVKKQKQQLDDMADRREQIEMMVAWRKELLEMEDIGIDAVNDVFIALTDSGINDAGRRDVRKLIKRFGLNEVITAAELSIGRYYDGREWTWEKAFSKLGGICYNRQKDREEYERFVNSTKAGAQDAEQDH